MSALEPFGADASVLRSLADWLLSRHY
jgi:hypothetical protein